MTANTDGKKTYLVEELRYVEFEPGRSDLNAGETRKLNALARFRGARKELIIGTEGHADRLKDGAELAEKQSAEEAVDEEERVENARDGSLEHKNVVDDRQLGPLARMRAENVLAYLTRQGGLGAKRVQLKPVGLCGPFQDSNRGVKFSLAVN